VVLLVIACSVATAAACAIGYALARDTRPFVLLSPEAEAYASQSLFTDAPQMAAFKARLEALASATQTSVVVTYVERPRNETVAAAMERSLEGLQSQLAGKGDDSQRSMLAIVLMGKPRFFGFIGTDHARTRVFLRNLSGDPAVHSLNFKHIQVSHGRYLMQGLAIAETALRPLNPLVEHHPAQWLVVAVLEWITQSIPDLPGETLLAGVRTVRAPLARLAADYGVPPIVLLIAPLVVLAFGLKRIEKAVSARLKPHWLKTAVWALSRTIPIPVAGMVAVVLYGSLESIASLAQLSGQHTVDLLQMARSLPTPTIPAWLTWLTIPAASVVALGVTVGIGLRLTGGDAHRLIAPSRWFAGWWWPLRVVLVAITVPVVLLLPVPLMVALASMEGLMSVALLVSMLGAWSEDVYRFWLALGEQPAAA
jgi:hypothetical protein